MSEAFFGSAEIRWFLEGQCGQLGEIQNWFRLRDQLPLIKEDKVQEYDPEIVDKPFIEQESQRTDEYLLIPDSDKTAVKQRQGKLEVKALVTGPRLYSLPSYGITGRMDQWVKWSFASSSHEGLEAELRQAGPWRKVIKDRYLQKYSFDSRSMLAVSPRHRPKLGCTIELTKIEVEANGSDWLTIGFEAFGPSGRVIAILDEALEHFFKSHGSAPVRLDGRDSFSYPTWLIYSQQAERSESTT
jgi:hypothetical protein